ncbi:MAG: D-Ala-D-Ala carboxypeptidase family metallohydrolase [Planctomycetota bacterium]
MHLKPPLQRFRTWVELAVIKTSLLCIGILLASAVLGFALFTSAHAGAAAANQAHTGAAPDTAATTTPAGPGGLSLSVTAGQPHAQDTHFFKVHVDRGFELSGLFEPGDTIFTPPQAHIDLRTADDSTLRFSAAADIKHTQSSQEADGPGHARFTVDADPGATFTICCGGADILHVVVLYPARQDVSKSGDVTTHVDGTPLGTLKDAKKCPSKLVREHLDCYVAPEYFARITDANADWPIVPHLHIGQMVAPETRWVDNKKVFTDVRPTDYFVPNRPLAEKLERIAEVLEQKGIHFDHWTVNSGYRTPAYNHSIGGATFSRHTWGDAIDLMIDTNHDHRMDDLNHDGHSDRLDGIIIAKVADQLEMEGKVRKGGVGVYQFDSDQSVGCHVHIDVRGYVVRWGQYGIGRTARGFTWWPASSYSTTGTASE